MRLYTHPRSLPRSTAFTLRVNDHPVEVLHTGVADFALLALDPADFPARVEVAALDGPLRDATVRPIAQNIPATIEDGVARFTLLRPEKLSIDLGGHKALYLFAQPPETNPPAPDASGVIRLPAGQITEIPVLTLEDGQTLHLPGGAVFKGRIQIKGRRGVRICGHGVIDGSFYDQARDGAPPCVILERCEDVLVEDVTMVRPQGWMLLLGACRGVAVRNLKQIGEVMSSDGIDIVGSRDVLVEDCFLHNNDDCVVVKACHVNAGKTDGTAVDARRDVENIRVRRCTFANWTAGNAMEIGHELSTASVRDIAFEEIDVLHVHGTGAVFSIHNYDRACVEDVRFERIRIEHCYDKFIDIRVSRSRYSSDAERGRVRRVLFRDITWHRSVYSPGYTVSLVGGWDPAHPVEDVALESVTINGRPVRDLDELEIHTRHCRDLRLR